MGRKNRSRDRRDANAIARRVTVSKFHSINDWPRRLHVPPSPKPLLTPVADRILRAAARKVVRRVTPAIADGRIFHPLGRARAAVTFSGTRAKIKRLLDAPRRLVKPLRKSRAKTGVTRKRKSVQFSVNRFGPDLDRQTKAIRAFDFPKTVPLCEARQTRREVIHAKGVAGSRVSKPKRGPHSDISCRG